MTEACLHAGGTDFFNTLAGQRASSRTGGLGEDANTVRSRSQVCAGAVQSMWQHQLACARMHFAPLAGAGISACVRTATTKRQHHQNTWMQEETKKGNLALYVAIVQHLEVGDSASSKLTVLSSMAKMMLRCLSDKDLLAFVGPSMLKLCEASCNRSVQEAAHWCYCRPLCWTLGTKSLCATPCAIFCLGVLASDALAEIAHQSTLFLLQMLSAQLFRAARSGESMSIDNWMAARSTAPTSPPAVSWRSQSVARPTRKLWSNGSWRMTCWGS